MRLVHPCFEIKWITVFQFKDSKSIDLIKRELYENKIISETQRGGNRAFLNADIPANIKNASYEITLGVIGTGVHIVKFQSHPTGEFRNCCHCDEIFDNTLYLVFSCPLSQCLWDLVREIVMILTKIRLNIKMKVAFINFDCNIEMNFASKNGRNFINTLLIITRRIIFIFYYKDNKGITSSDISYKWMMIIRLIKNFSRENYPFLSVKLDKF